MQGTHNTTWFSLRPFPHPRWSEMGALLRETFNEWSDDKAQRLGASLAFYTLLSLAPLLVIVIAVAAFVFGREAVQGQLAWQIQTLVGRNAAQVVQALIQGAQKPASGAIATILSLLTLLFGASSVVMELYDALNTVWHVPAPNTSGIAGSFWSLAKDRMFSFALVLGAGLLLLGSLLWSTWIALMGKLFGSFLPIPEFLWHLANFAVSFLAITLLFGAIYKIVPRVHLTWSDVLVGASVTSLVFTIGKQLIALYLGKESFASTYGAAGSLVMLLVWVYYSAQLFFLGAEFTKIYTKRVGSHFSATLQLTTPQVGASIELAPDQPVAK
jgi:membrane protein